MVKTTKYIFLIAIVAPLLLTGCNDWFDKGDTERAFDGEDQVAFRTVENEIDEGDSQTLEIQFISSNGLADSDIQINFAVSDETTANPDYYTVPSSPVTISSGSASTTMTVETSDDPNIESGDEVRLVLEITDASNAKVAPNLSTTTIFIQGQ